MRVSSSIQRYATFYVRLVSSFASGEGSLREQGYTFMFALSSTLRERFLWSRDIIIISALDFQRRWNGIVEMKDVWCTSNEIGYTLSSE